MASTRIWRCSHRLAFAVAGFTETSVHELREALDDDRGVVLLDVRDPSSPLQRSELVNVNACAHCTLSAEPS